MTTNQKPTCPCCPASQTRAAVRKDLDSAGRVVQCRKCSAIYTVGQSTIYLGESYNIVRPWFTTDQTADDRAVYFDLSCLGSEGLMRRHGWFDPTSKLITQVG